MYSVFKNAQLQMTEFLLNSERKVCLHLLMLIMNICRHYEKDMYFVHFVLILFYVYKVCQC